MNRGFTLAELLAIIVILAFLALLIVPKITDSIEYAKEEGVKSSIKNIYSAADQYYYRNNGVKNRTIDLTTDEIKYDGNIEKGQAKFDTEGNLSIYIYKDGYCARTSDASDIEIEKINIGDCGFNS